MIEPQATTPKIDFCELKHALAETHSFLTDVQLLEVADDMHDAIRERHGHPKSGHSEC